MSGEMRTQGTLIQIGSAASPQTFTENVANVTGISGIGGEASEIDITNFDSTFKEYLMGLKDGGSVTLEINFDTNNTTQRTLWTLHINQTTRQFRWLFVNGDYLEFNAFVKSFQFNGAPDDVVKASLTLRVTGPIGLKY